jgi:hypothetical protein
MDPSLGCANATIHARLLGVLEEPRLISPRGNATRKGGEMSEAVNVQSVTLFKGCDHILAYDAEAKSHRYLQGADLAIRGKERDPRQGDRACGEGLSGQGR